MAMKETKIKETNPKRKEEANEPRNE